MDSEKIAIIDLGTNTFHLLITELNERDDFVVKEKYKEPVKLGEGGITKGYISEKAYARGIQTLIQFRKLTNSKGASKVFAYATSAVRGAANGKDFVRDAKEKADINVRIINGNEEAALIFEGVKNGVQLPWDKYSLLVDIGGGSVEFAVAHENKPLLLRSLNIGAARLIETIHPGDPITETDLQKTREHLREKMGSLIEELKEFELELLCGSSGTFETLGSLIAHKKKDFLSMDNLNSYPFSTKEFSKVHTALIQSDKKERLAMEGMDPMRVDMIVMGSLLVDLVLKELGIKKIMVCTTALKEGIYYRYVEDKRQRLNHLIGHADKNLRAKSVRNLGKRMQYERDHGLKVSELALSLYSQLKPLHPFGEVESELLRYSALLHDIGYFLNRSGHHKHGQYLIMHSGLQGFSNDELLIMGNVVRYHRKSLPTRDHFHYKILKQEHRYLVRVLAAILRIADHLDRGHAGHVEKVQVTITEEIIHIQVHAPGGADIEIASASEQTKLMEQVFERIVVIEAAPSN